jgi:glycosyltransferase involved in cell wall biosynthesis
MKIAMVSSWGIKCGIYTYTKGLATELSKNGVEVYIVRLPGIKIISPESIIRVSLSIPEDVDLIHVQHEYGLFQNNEPYFYDNLKVYGKPIVTTMHAVGNWIIDEKIASSSDIVIAHNSYCFRQLVDKKKAMIIPHYSNPKTPNDSESSKKFYKIEPNDVPTVGYVGYITPHKGLEVLIDAMKDFNKVGLVIAGGYHTNVELNYMNSLKERTLKELPSRCMWLGFIPESQLNVVYGAIDLIVYPSRYASESGALLMALSYGKPVIASNVAAFREKKDIVKLFNDLDDLREKIKETVFNKQELERMHKASRDYAESVSLDKIAKKHLLVYESLLKK